MTPAIYVLMVCTINGIPPHLGDPRPCVPLEITYDSMDKCNDAIDDLAKFWLQNMGELPQMPMHCEEEGSHT